MTIDERLESITRNLEILAKIQIDNNRQFRERFQRITQAQERNAREIQAFDTLVHSDAENIRALTRKALDRLEER